MRPWLLDQKDKLKKAEAKLKNLHKKLDATNEVDEFKNLCSEIAAVDLKIEAIRARLKGKWAGAVLKTYKDPE